MLGAILCWCVMLPTLLVCMIHIVVLIAQLGAGHALGVFAVLPGATVAIVFFWILLKICLDNTDGNHKC